MAVKAIYSNNNQVFTIHVSELFSFSLLDEFRRAYQDERARQAKEVIVDLRNTHAMDSSALGMLLNMQQHLNKNDGDIRIINARPDVKKILLIARFDKKFQVE